MTTGIFEYDPTTGAKLGALELLGQFVGYNMDGSGIFVPLNVAYLGPNTLPKINGAPTLSGAIPTRTSTHISWFASTDDPVGTGPPVSWEVQRATSTDDGVTFGDFTDVTGSPFSAATTTYNETGLATGAPEIIWSYRVRAINAIGASPWSNVFNLQWAGAQTQQPTAPTGLSHGVVSDTTAVLQWSESVDASVTKHGIFKNGVLVVDDIGSTLTSYTWSGLNPSTTYTPVDVRRWNGQWSPASNSISFTTQASTAPTYTMMMGVSATAGSTHGGTNQWDGWRCYSESVMLTQAALTGSDKPLFLAYSESGPNLGDASPNYTTIFNHVRSVLDDFYYNGSGQTHSSRWGIKMFWSNGNENQDKGALATPHTSAGIANYVTSQKALYDACHYIDPVTSAPRYPDAYAGSNPTHNAEQQGLVADWLHPSARYHDFVMWSMYPPGRGTTYADPTFNYPSLKESDRTDQKLGYMIRCFYRTFQAQAQARIDRNEPTYNLMISCGEINNGVDPDDSTTRPYTSVHGLAGGMMKLALQYQLPPAYMCWWDNDIGNSKGEFAQEPGTTNPSTRVVWQDWLSYNHEFGGTHPSSWAGNPKSSWKTTGPVT